MNCYDDYGLKWHFYDSEKEKNRNSEMGRFRADQEERYLEMIQNPLERTWTFRILEHNSGT